MKIALATLLLLSNAFAQVRVPGPGGGPSGAGIVAITVESSCTGTGTGVDFVPCSTALTFTNGDAILCGGVTNGSSFDASNIVFSDNTNGYYALLTGYNHPTQTTNDWTAIGIMENATSPATPQIHNYEGNGMPFTCYAVKGVPTSYVADGGAVNLTKSATGTNPTAGSVTAPTNGNEIGICFMNGANNTGTTSVGSGYSGLISAIQTLTTYSQYQIQTTAVAINCPMTNATSKAYRDTQVALVNAANTGARGLAGVYGSPAVAQTNGATATTTILTAQPGGVLSTLNAPAGSTIITEPDGVNVTFDTSVAPIGSHSLIMNGVSHVIGDAGTSMLFPGTAGSTTSTSYQANTEGYQTMGQPHWVSFFWKLGSGTSNGQGCDTISLFGGIKGIITAQAIVAAGTIGFDMEDFNSDTNAPSGTIAQGTNVRLYLHAAGLNEANNQVVVATCSGTCTTALNSTWSVALTVNKPWVGTPIATTTATGSPASNQIVVGSATGIVIGQSVTGTNGQFDYSPGTYVTAITGTTVTLNQNPLNTLVAKTVYFGGMVATTSGTTNGTTTLTVTSGTGLVAGGLYVGQFIQKADVPVGTYLASGSGTTWTMSQAATGSTTSQTSFWTPANGNLAAKWGKYSSCSITTQEWFSAMVWDVFGTYGALIP
jgi:hypothetical protein